MAWKGTRFKSVLPAMLEGVYPGAIGVWELYVGRARSMDDINNTPMTPRAGVLRNCKENTSKTT